MDAKNGKWVGRTAYQLMPDRFFKGGGIEPKHINGRRLKDWQDRMPDWRPDYDGEYRNLYFYGGNLKGIEEKLSYLKKLGFDMLYLTPIEQSKSYHHYDVGNHSLIDPWLGTWEDFRLLCSKAHELGMLIVPDLVFNHTGIDSTYFYRQPDWYKRDLSGNIVFWGGFKDMPECNTQSIKYQNAMSRVVEHYLDNGADGFRLDLGENLPKDFLHAIARVKEIYPEVLFIGEMWEFASDKEDPKIYDGQLDSIMNYPMSDAVLRWTRYGYGEHFSYNFNRVYGEYPQNVQNVLLNNIGTHDTPTTITMLGGDKMNSNVFDNRIWDIERPWRGYNTFDTFAFRRYEAEHDRLDEAEYRRVKNLLQIALAIMYNIPGIPCVFQGTEIGEMGYKDPFNRKPYQWEETKQDKELQQFVAELGMYRKNNNDILAEGKARILKADDTLLVLERTSETSTITVFANRSKKVHDVSEFVGDKYKVVFQTKDSAVSQINPYGLLITRSI